MSIEHFCSPKELGPKLAQLGVPELTTRACRELISDMKEHGMPTMLGKTVRPSDAYAFLSARPKWTPFGRKQ